jgi:agmatinase
MTRSGDAPLHDNYGLTARSAVERAAWLPTTARVRAAAHGLPLGLPDADSLVDKRIPTFSLSDPPYFAAIDTLLKAPYVEDVRTRGDHDVVVYAPGASLFSPVPPKDPARNIAGRVSWHD